MKTIFKVALIAALICSYSCDKDTEAHSVQELSAVDAKGGKDVPRPISITLQGADNQSGIGGTFTGKMKHLGKINGTVAPGDFVDQGGGVFTFDTLPGENDVINAANGDQLFSRGSLTFQFISATEATYSGTITFIGGTGRFVGASGSMQINDGFLEVIGINDLGGPLSIFSHTGNGTIIY